MSPINAKVKIVKKNADFLDEYERSYNLKDLVTQVKALVGNNQVMFIYLEVST